MAGVFLESPRQLPGLEVAGFQNNEVWERSFLGLRFHLNPTLVIVPISYR
jgi:hypothetical protein